MTPTHCKGSICEEERTGLGWCRCACKPCKNANDWYADAGEVAAQDAADGKGEA